MSRLTKYAFSDLYDMSSGISTSKAQAGHGSPFVSFSTVFNNYFLPDEIDDLMDTTPQEQEKYSIKKGDILITRTSETVDELAMSCVALKDYPNTTFSGFVKRLRPKTEGIAYDRYMAFFLRSKYFRKVIDCNTIMTLRASFNEDIFSFLDIYLPDYEQQVKIGDFLYEIEQKIIKNKKINDNLQQQLQLLYNYWFTQFDFPDSNGKPYYSTGGAMIWNEQLKTHIPNSFRVIPLSEILLFQSGYPFSSDSFITDGMYKLITIKNVQDTGIDLNVDNHISDIPVNMHDYCLLQPKDILMSLTGNVGRVGLMYSDNCLLNQRVAVVKEHDSSLHSYIYFLLKNELIRKKLETIAGGSSQANLSPIEAAKINIAFNEQTAKNFSLKANATIETMVSNMRENHQLQKLRNWLLPILMNGQVTVSD